MNDGEVDGDEVLCPFCGWDVWMGEGACRHLLASWALDPYDDGGALLGEMIYPHLGVAGSQDLTRDAARLCGWVWSVGEDAVDERLTLAEKAVPVAKPAWWTVLSDAILEGGSVIDGANPDVDQVERASLAGAFANLWWMRCLKSSPESALLPKLSVA